MASAICKFGLKRRSSLTNHRHAGLYHAIRKIQLIAAKVLKICIHKNGRKFGMSATSNHLNDIKQ